MQRASKREIEGWFHRKSVSGEYYTPHPTLKSIFHLVGSGKKLPTPKEMYDMLQRYPNANLIGNLLLQEYDHKDTEEKAVALPPGCYRYFPSPYPEKPERLVPMELRKDDLVKMPGITRQIVKDVRLFLENEAIYREIGIQYRRGILLYGSPGQGKSSILREIIRDEVPKDSIIIFITELPSARMLKKLQEEEAARLKVIIFEELTSIIGRNNVHIEPILDFLDGETSLDRALIFGTTNYPEQLPGNIVDRPSRFDRLIKVGNPNKTTRKDLLTFYLSREPSNAEIEITEDMSVAAIKESAILSRLHKTTVEQAVAHLKKVHKIFEKDFEESELSGLKRVRELPDFFDGGREGAPAVGAHRQCKP
jgi:hypothetical protein